MPADRSTRREAMGAAAVLTVQQAAELLPCADGEARRWIEAHGLVRNVAGRPCVVWGMLLDVIAAEGDPEKKAPPVKDRAPRVHLAAPTPRGRRAS